MSQGQFSTCGQMLRSPFPEGRHHFSMTFRKLPELPFTQKSLEEYRTTAAPPTQPPPPEVGLCASIDPGWYPFSKGKEPAW